MGIIDFGQQVSVFSYKGALTSQGLGSLNYKIKNPGIYEGFQISKINDSTISISTGSFVIEDESSEVSSSTRTTTSISSLTVSSVNNYIIFRFIFLNSTSNYIDCLAVQSSQVLDTDVVIAKLNYTVSTLTSVDYSYRTFGNINEESTLLDPQANVLWINTGTNFWFIGSFTIKYVIEKANLNSLVLSLASGNYYLVYNGSAYATEVDSTVISYSTTKNGWYDTNNYKVLAHFYYNGSNSIEIIGIFEKKMTYESRDITLGAASPSDNKLATQRAVNIHLETRGFSDYSTIKNLSNINWDTNTIIKATGEYFVTGSTQTGTTPDGTTNTDWFVIVNIKGADNTVLSQIATNKTTNKTYTRILDTTYGVWKCVSTPRASSLVIASSTSIDKLNADYVCDGTADDVQIQAAIDALASGGTYGLGGTVTLLEGVYNIATNILIKSNVNLVGQGSGTVLTRASASLSQVILVNNAVINFTLRDFDIYAANMGSYSIYGIYCANNTSNTNSKYLRIKSSVATNAHGYGFYNCLYISNCIGLGNTASANLGLGFYNCLYISNCIGTGTGSGGGDGYGFYNCLYISNCIGTGTGSDGYGFSDCRKMIGNNTGTCTTAKYKVNTCTPSLAGTDWIATGGTDTAAGGFNS